MSNDNIPKERKKASSEVLRESDDTEKEDDKENNKSSVEFKSKNATPNNYDTDIVIKDIEIEDRESYKLKQSLGI